EDLGQVARIAKLLPGIHVQQAWSSGGNERCVSRCGDLSHAGKDFDIGRRMVEIEIADDATIRHTAWRSIFFFIHLLKQRALVPGSAFELLDRLAQVLLGNVENA